jgi:N-acetylmuramoyl-L-alanine amidase
MLGHLFSVRVLCHRSRVINRSFKTPAVSFSMKTIILDPGHGMSNRSRSVFDPGACAGGLRECDIALTWANALRAILKAKGAKVVRTRVDNEDPAPVSARAGIAKEYGGAVMLSFHCNAATGTASGTETFYRGAENLLTAGRINNAVVLALGTKSRGVKTESESQHSRLAVMRFQPCFLLEIGFIDNPDDRQKMTNEKLMLAACNNLADILMEFV